jgi:hypothetical protein
MRTKTMSNLNIICTASFLSTFCAAFLPSEAQAAWPDSYAERVVAMDALSFDMSTPEIPHNEAEVARRYKKACSMGYNLACKWEKWQGSEGGDPQVAMEYFVE